MRRKKVEIKIEPTPKKWLSTREVMAYLDVSEDFVKNLRDEARISFSKIGSKYLHDLSSIEKLLNRNRI